MKWNGSVAHKPFSSQWALGFFFCVCEHLNVQFLSAQVNIWPWRRVSVSGVPAGKHCVPALCWSRSLDKGLPWKKKKTLAGMEEDLKARERWETHSSAWGEIMKNEEEENDRESRRGERDGGRIWRSSEGLGISSGQHRACGWEGSAERCGREISWAGWLAVRHLPLTHQPPTTLPLSVQPRRQKETL